MTNGALTPKPSLTDRNSDGFKALRSLVASGTHHRGSSFAATEGPALLDWIRSAAGSHASWNTFWEYVDAVLPTDAREEVAPGDVRLYSAAALLGYINEVDYETPIPNGNGLKFGEVRTRGTARQGDRRPSVRDRELDYKAHGVARKAFIIALCKPGTPEDLTEKSPDIREITYALAEKLESWSRPVTRGTTSPRPATQTHRANIGGRVIDQAPAVDMAEPPQVVKNLQTGDNSEPGAGFASLDTRHDHAIREPSRNRRGEASKFNWVWWLAGTLVAAAAIAAAAIVLPLTTPSPSVELELVSAPAPRAVDEIDWTGMPMFWLPATDALGGFPDPVAFDCHDPEIRSWLAANGQLQAGVMFRVRNLDPEKTVSLERISLQGENTPPTPGFIFGCADGGRGGDDGEIDYSYLSLTARDQALAGFLNRKAADFQRTVEPYSVAGISISLVGDEDFEGTLVLHTRLRVDEVQQTALPSTDDPYQPQRIVHHGIPDKNLVRVLIGTDGSLSCKSGDKFIQPCTLAQARQVISDAWEDE